MQVYTLFSRKPEFEVWQNLRQLQVRFAVLENAWCAGRSESVFALLLNINSILYS